MELWLNMAFHENGVSYDQQYSRNFLKQKCNARVQNAKLQLYMVRAHQVLFVCIVIGDFCIVMSHETSQKSKWNIQYLSRKVCQIYTKIKDAK